MCGIVGLLPKRSNGFFRSDVDLLKNLLVVDGMFRGEDSTGVFQVQQNRQVFSVKTATFPHLLFKSSQWQKFENRMTSSSKLVIGHNRKATMGELSSKNAHPFHEGNIILVHNGTLHNHRDFADTSVDSHAIAKAFNEGNAEEILPKIRGAFTFVWYDIQKERLFIIRNDERPFTITETSEMFYFASEAWMPNILRQRMSTNAPEGTDIKVEPGVLYEFNPFDGKYTTKKIELNKGGNSEHFFGGQQRGHYLPTRVQGQGYRGTTRTTAGTTHGATSTRGTTQVRMETGHEGSPFKDCSSGVINLFPDVRRAFKDGDEVLVKVTTATRKGTTDQWAVTGIVAMPGKPNADINGTLYGLQPGSMPDYVGKLCTATVSHIVDLTCGPIVHVKSVELSLDIPSWTEMIPYVEWEYVVDNCKCSKCGAGLDFNHSNTTYVKRTKMGVDATYYVECPECVEKRLEESNVEGTLNEFKQRRYPAVQNGKSKRDGAGKGTNAIIVHPSSNTLQ